MRRITLVFVLLFLTTFYGCALKDKEGKNNPTVSQHEEYKQPKNIILLIGDGMGLSQLSSRFFFGEGEPNFKRFKHIGLIKTSSALQKITDSAAGATAFSTGEKSYNGAIGVTADSSAAETIAEIAAKNDISVGIIATSSITHATPASFYAHQRSRSMNEAIAEDLVSSSVNFFSGGGLQFFTDRSDNANLLKKLEEAGFLVATDSIRSEHQFGKKYGYLLADDGLPRMAEGRGAYEQKATKAALDYLSHDQDGFFLMVEGSQIDWGGHANEADYLIEEVIDFDKTIGVALDFAKENGETLVIVTADHETGGFTLASAKKKDENGKTYSDYNEIGPTFSTHGHSAALIPVFAYGPGAAAFQGIYENTAIFDKMIKLSGWEK